MKSDLRKYAIEVVDKHWFGAERARALSLLEGEAINNQSSTLCERLFADTAGIPIFQQQVMDAAIELADFSPEMADALRIALGKRDNKKIASLRSLFIRNGIANGHPRPFLAALFSEMERVAPYLYPFSPASSSQEDSDVGEQGCFPSLGFK